MMVSEKIGILMQVDSNTLKLVKSSISEAEQLIFKLFELCSEAGMIDAKVRLAVWQRNSG
jgi:hypothetical protein